MKNTKLLILLFTSLLLVGCNDSEIEALQQRLNEAESQLEMQSSTMSLAVGALESGRCTIAEVEEDSALLTCGDGTSYRIRNGQDGNSCTVMPTVNGSQISCTDGTTALITNGSNGTNGSDGEDGSNGEDGTSCTVTQSSNGSQVSCSDGSAAFISNGANGSSCSVVETEEGARVECEDGTLANILNGIDGQDGQDGSNGTDGYGCVVTQVEGVGALVECGEGENRNSVVIYDGQDGQDGTNGEAGQDGENGQDGVSAVVEYIDPCGDEGRFDEILLRMADGSILAHYSSGNRQFLTLIGPGNYRTTDGLKCNFTITDEMEVISN